jgi:pyruvate dehydrogenase E1 component alpha subunit
MFTGRLLEAGVVQKAELDAIDREVGALIEEAVTGAKAAPLPAPKELLTDVYVAY